MPDHTEDMNVRRDKAGYFEEVPSNKPVRCDEDEESCAVDDDPNSAAMHPPGTSDDLPYTLGEEEPEPADLHVDFAVDAPGREPSACGDETDLWDAQQALISIDEESGYNVEGFSEDERDRIGRALGDDAAEVVPEAPEGTSATGSAARPGSEGTSSDPDEL